MKTITNNTGIVKSFGNIVAAMLLENELKAGVHAVQLKQTVETTYPSKKAGNSLSDSLFTDEEFGFDGGKSYTSTRTFLLPVPKGTTIAKVQAMVDMLPEATLQKYISYDIMDVLTDEQKYAVGAGIRTIEDYQASLSVKDGDGKVVLNDAGEPQYQQHFFRKAYIEDEDFRTLLQDAKVPVARKLTNLDKLVKA